MMKVTNRMAWHIKRRILLMADLCLLPLCCGPTPTLTPKKSTDWLNHVSLDLEGVCKLPGLQGLMKLFYAYTTHKKAKIVKNITKKMLKCKKFELPEMSWAYCVYPSTAAFLCQFTWVWTLACLKFCF